MATASGFRRSLREHERMERRPAREESRAIHRTQPHRIPPRDLHVVTAARYVRTRSAARFTQRIVRGSMLKLLIG